MAGHTDIAVPVASEPPVGSTRYEVKVAPGIESLDNTSLERGFTGTFETPRLQLASTWTSRNATLQLEPYWVLRFSQTINAQDLLPYLSLKAESSLVGFELISVTDPSLPRQVQDALSRSALDRTLVIRPTAPLSPDTSYTLSVAPGAPSAEGPLRTLEEQHAEWRTYGPLAIAGAGCGTCAPGDSFHIGFSNPLDTDSLRDGLVSIKPDLPDGEMHISPGGIWLTGSTEPDTVYTLRVAPGLTDVYGQVLNRVEERRFRVIRPYVERTEALHLPNFVEVLHPDDGGRYSILTRDLDNLEIRLYQVTPSDWHSYVATRHGLWGPSWGTTGPNSRRLFMSVHHGVAGHLGLADRKPVLETTLSIDNGSDSVIDETILDLNPYLEGGYGQLVLVIELPDEIREKIFCGYDRAIATWLQVTDLALDTHTDGDSDLDKGFSVGFRRSTHSSDRPVPHSICFHTLCKQ